MAGGTHIRSTGHDKGKAAEGGDLHQIIPKEALEDHTSNKVQTKDQAESHPGGVAATRQKSYQTTITGAELPPALAAKQLADMLSKAASEATGEAHKNAANMYLISDARWWRQYTRNALDVLTPYDLSGDACQQCMKRANGTCIV